jgi:hypothetical protein
VGPFAWALGLNHIFMPGLNGGFTGVKTFQPVRMAVHYLKPFDDEDLCNDEKKWPLAERYNQSLVVGCGSIEKRGPFHNTTKNPDHADMYDMFEFFRDNGKNIIVGVEGVDSWVKANVTLSNPPNTLVTNPTTGITTVANKVVNKLHVKQILSSDGFSKVPEEAADENPSKLRPMTAAADGLYNGEKVYTILIPSIVHLHGYDKTEHSKKNKIEENFVVFSPSDCSPAGKVQQ